MALDNHRRLIKSAAITDINDSLHSASSKECMKLLLEAKADINHKESIHGETPVLYKINRSHVPFQEELLELIEFMIQSKADVNIPDNYGYTVFSYDSVHTEKLMKILLPAPVAPDVPIIA